MKIRTPVKRAYYPASPNEKTRLVCWISREAMQQMVVENQIPAQHLQDYPDGLEVEVTESAFEEFSIHLDVTPTQLKRAYIKLLVEKKLPPSGMVEGMALEAMALGGFMPSFGVGRAFPEPEMTEGDDPMEVLRCLQ
jgi:hypothetical protein